MYGEGYVDCMTHVMLPIMSTFIIIIHAYEYINIATYKVYGEGFVDCMTHSMLLNTLFVHAELMSRTMWIVKRQ